MAYDIVGIDLTIWHVPDMASVSGIDDFLYEPTRPPKSCRY
jgi:hypothetical protein